MMLSEGRNPNTAGRPKPRPVIQARTAAVRVTSGTWSVASVHESDRHLLVPERASHDEHDCRIATPRPKLSREGGPV